MNAAHSGEERNVWYVSNHFWCFGKRSVGGFCHIEIDSREDKALLSDWRKNLLLYAVGGI